MPSNIFASASTSSLNLPAFGAAFPTNPPAPSPAPARAETTAVPTSIKLNNTETNAHKKPTTTIYYNPLANATATTIHKPRSNTSFAGARAHRIALAKELQVVLFHGVDGCRDWTTLPVFVAGNEFVGEQRQRHWEVQHAGTLAANGERIGGNRMAGNSADSTASPVGEKRPAATSPLTPPRAMRTTAWSGWTSAAQTADDGEGLLFDFEGGGNWGRMPDNEPLFKASATTSVPEPARQPMEEVKRRSDAKRPSQAQSPMGPEPKRARVPIWKIESETDVLDSKSKSLGNKQVGAAPRTPRVERWGECRGEVVMDKFGEEYYQVTQAEDLCPFSDEDEEDALCMKTSCPIRARKIADAIDDADFDAENDPEEEVDQPAGGGRGLVGRILEKAKPWFKRGGWMEKIIMGENAEEMGKQLVEDVGSICKTHEVCVVEAEEARRPLVVSTPGPRKDKATVVGVAAKSTGSTTSARSEERKTTTVLTPLNASKPLVASDPIIETVATNDVAQEVGVMPAVLSKERKALMGLTPLTASKTTDTPTQTTSQPIDIPTVANPRPAEVQYESVVGPWRRRESMGWMDAMMAGAWTG